MEDLYQYCWKYRICDPDTHLNDGTPFRVVSPGVLNEGGGPDFSCARIDIDGVEMAGDVEVHVKASDWYRHAHDSDAAYDNVVLHVVSVDDRPVATSAGRTLPQYELIVPKDVVITYARLTEGLHGIRCSDDLKRLYPIEVADMLQALGIERLQAKAQRIVDILHTLNGDWQHATLITIARALGTNLNGDAFEQLAMSLNLNTLGRHSDNIMQLEALLFGQAGMLDSSMHIFDEYYQTLCREYFFLARKYTLRPMPASAWRYAGTRPQNFPHRRIAMLARLLEGGFSLMRNLIDKRADIDAIMRMFAILPSDYWLSHFAFGSEENKICSTMSADTIRLLIINGVAPFLYAYGSLSGNYDIADDALRMLEILPPEKNAIIRNWGTLGIDAASAFDSQALLQLRKQYCDRERCRNCRLGYYILKRLSKNN